MAEYYRLTSERAEAIAKAGGFTVGHVRDFCLADWPNFAEHQAWLDSASVGEIAAWIEASSARQPLDELTPHEERLIEAAVALSEARVWEEAARLEGTPEAIEEARREVARATVRFLAVRAEERI